VTFANKPARVFNSIT